MARKRKIEAEEIILKLSDRQRHKRDCGEDEENEQTLKTISTRVDLILDILEVQMASIQDLQNKLNEVKASQATFIGKVDSLRTEMVNAFNRLEAKIAAGSETQPLIDELNTLADEIAAKSQDVDNAIAAAQVSGI